MNTGKGDTKSSLFVDNWLSDKKIQKNHLKTTQPEENSLRYLDIG